MTFIDDSEFMPNGTRIPIATLVSSTDYYPFGETLRELLPGSLPSDAKFKYQGKERDIETGYDYFEARMFDAQLGRFMQVDPMAEKFQLMNPYIGIGDNPINLIDPNGMEVRGDSTELGKAAKEINDALKDKNIKDASVKVSSKEVETSIDFAKTLKIF